MFCVPRDCYRIYVLKRGFNLIFLGYDNICFILWFKTCLKLYLHYIVRSFSKSYYHNMLKKYQT